MSRPSTSSGVYGRTDVIVGMFDLTTVVGMISIRPPIATATNARSCRNVRRPRPPTPSIRRSATATDVYQRGRPGAKGQPEWPAYTTERRATMEIDAQCRVVDDPNSAERQMWQQLEP